MEGCLGWKCGWSVVVNQPYHSSHSVIAGITRSREGTMCHSSMNCSDYRNLWME